MELSFNFTEKVIFWKWFKEAISYLLMILTGCFAWLIMMCDTQPTSTTSCINLGNNDELNPSAHKIFSSKEIYEGNVIEWRGL